MRIEVPVTRCAQHKKLHLVLASALVLGGCLNPESEATRASAEATNAAASTSSAANASATSPAKLEADAIVVYYFHGNKRCRTCKGIQQAIQSTVGERFSAETKSGALVFHEVNTDSPENAHFVQDFDLSSSSMVVVAKNGEQTLKWENCAEVWPLSHQPAELTVYVEKQIRNYLGLVRRT